jgi:hypothetical protein
MVLSRSTDSATSAAAAGGAAPAGRATATAGTGAATTAGTGPAAAVALAGASPALTGARATPAARRTAPSSTGWTAPGGSSFPRSCFATSLARRAAVGLFPAARATSLSAAGLLVHRGPGTPLRFAAGHATALVSLFDVLGLTLLLVGVRGLVAPWHIMTSGLSDRLEHQGPLSLASKERWIDAAVGWVTCSR